MPLSKQESQKNLKNPNSSTEKRARGHAHIDDNSRHAITIGRPVEEVFQFFRDFSNLPMFMKDLKEVRVLSAQKSHWVVQLKNGLEADWDAEITSERANEMIAWKSVQGSDVDTTGSVWFTQAAGGKGTVVSLSLEYVVPGGKLTEVITKLTGEDPDSLAHINLRRLKALLETGEIPTTDGQPTGREEQAETIVKH